MKLIDTNIFVDHFRNHKPAVEFFKSLIEKENGVILFFSAITETELLAGEECDNSDKREKVIHFLHRWNKIPVSNQIAELAGDLTRKYNLEIPDSIVASTALLNNLELLTKNIKHFKSIHNIKIKEPY